MDMAIREIEMSVIKTIINLFKCECPAQDNPKSDMDERLDRMKKHIIERATVNGEDDWMLRVRKHDKRCTP
jgi:hypothetical protein